MRGEDLAATAVGIAIVAALMAAASAVIDWRNRRQREAENRALTRKVEGQNDTLAAVRLAVQSGATENTVGSPEYRMGYLACAQAVLRELDHRSEGESAP